MFIIIGIPQPLGIVTILCIDLGTDMVGIEECLFNDYSARVCVMSNKREWSISFIALHWTLNTELLENKSQIQSSLSFLKQPAR